MGLHTMGNRKRISNIVRFTASTAESSVEAGRSTSSPFWPSGHSTFRVKKSVRRFRRSSNMGIVLDFKTG